MCTLLWWNVNMNILIRLCVNTTTVGKPQATVCSLGQHGLCEDGVQPHNKRVVLTQTGSSSITIMFCMINKWISFDKHELFRTQFVFVFFTASSFNSATAEFLYLSDLCSELTAFCYINTLTWSFRRPACDSLEVAVVKSFCADTQRRKKIL